MDRKPPDWFVQELTLISSDLRIIWGRESYGVELWVIERQLPPFAHAMHLEHLARSGQERYVHQKLTNEDGDVIGFRKFDRAPEWRHAHYVAVPGKDLDLPESYREPDQRDLDVIREWIYGTGGHASSDTRDNPKLQLRELKDAAQQRANIQREEESYVRRHASRTPGFRGDLIADIGSSRRKAEENHRRGLLASKE